MRPEERFLEGPTAGCGLAIFSALRGESRVAIPEGLEPCLMRGGSKLDRRCDLVATMWQTLPSDICWQAGQWTSTRVTSSIFARTYCKKLAIWRFLGVLIFGGVHILHEHGTLELNNTDDLYKHAFFVNPPVLECSLSASCWGNGKLRAADTQPRRASVLKHRHASGSHISLYTNSYIGERLRGNTIRGNRTESLWEGNRPLRGSLWGRVFRGFHRFSEVLSETLSETLSEADFPLRSDRRIPKTRRRAVYLCSQESPRCWALPLPEIS